ncbi:TetR family transcriptional regulator [Enemella evansiae]|uniref:TetR family transcriptional regulator n=2 Tax=Enemella evansiae TaxID=2016499 RepID=A0A255GPL5_9ACTN|nr:TetR/AcrR family transcriptional regulator [Enemella evansiae]OYO00509.1 TetR family transcriptional regulator [Enemella evansiae]OYO06100.1 TetR family transcriptional regulator [Enemella evansiae]OYO17765.1 TetR family transcriptional regulator [Enemella evansiae]
MPRAGLTTAAVVEAGCSLADEVGLDSLSMASLAERLGVRTPALYKHIDGLGGLRHAIAVRGMNQMAELLEEAIQGSSRKDAVRAILASTRTYLRSHPGMYAATLREELGDQSDPLLAASTRVVTCLRAALAGYDIAEADLDHAVRTVRCTVHGFAQLEAENAFHWDANVADSVEYLTDFIDRGLGGGGHPPHDEKRPIDRRS